jgi:DNA adenine methylase
MATKAKRITSPLKWHGGKHYLASKIVALMPPHTHYVEPFAGGLSVLLAKPCEGISEVVNDIDGELTNFWRVLRNDFDSFRLLCQQTPFSEADWISAKNSFPNGSLALGMNPTWRAWAFFVLCRQSLSGRMESFAAISRNRTRCGMNEQVAAWLSAIDGLPEIHARLKRVLVLNRNAIDVIRTEDGPQTLFYLDPPYHPDTRVSKQVYRHEMAVEDHCELLFQLSKIKGKFLLSGYNCEPYQLSQDAHGWTRHEFKIPNHAASGKTKRMMTECVWINF